MAKRYDIETTVLDPLPGQPEVLALPTSGPLVIPGGGLLSDASFGEVDGDLLIELSDGTRLIVPDYFELSSPPPLATDAGAHVAPDIVAAMTGADAVAGFTPVAPVAAPIGRVEVAEGDVRIVRADGTRIDAEAGMLVGREDRIDTGADGQAGFLFADESTFAIGGNGKVIFQDLVFDPDSGAMSANFVVQDGAFSFSGGAISSVDGAYVIKTPSATLSIDNASGAGRVEADGTTTVVYLRTDEFDPGLIRVANPSGTQVLDTNYETVGVDGFFERPTDVFRIGPRDAVEHFGDAIGSLPDAFSVMPTSLLQTERHLDPATRARGEDDFGPDFMDDVPGDGTLAGELQVDRDAAFEIAARKAAIAAAARDAADQAIGDATRAEQAARDQAAQTRDTAAAKTEDAETLRAHAVEILKQSERHDRAFEEAVRETEAAVGRETDAARAVAETDLAEAQAAERLASAEEAVRRALEAADQARNEALKILEEAKAREAVFADAQRAAADAQAQEEARALAVAEADAAEEAAAAALRAAEAAEIAARAEAEAAARIAEEAGTAAEIVEKVVERELAAIDPDLLKPPAPDDPSATKGDWITNARATMDVASAAMSAGEAAARDAYQRAIRGGASIENALGQAVAAAEAFGGRASADMVIAAGPDGLIDRDDLGDGPVQIAGGSGAGGFSGNGAGTGAIGSDVLIGAGGSDVLGGGGGFGFGGIDGLFGYGFRFMPIFVGIKKIEKDDRDDPVFSTGEETTANVLAGTSLADFLVGDGTSSTLVGREDDDYLYGDTPINYLSGTHNAGSPLLNPAFAATGGDDLLSGGAGDDFIWGGAGNDTLYGDLGSASVFGVSLGSAGNGADTLRGGDGNDTLYGQGGADLLEGEDGDDTFVMGDDDGADDTVRGGDASTDTGTDTVDYAGAGAAVTIDLNAGSAVGATTGTDSLSGIENATGSAYDDTLTGNADANTLIGNGGADTISGLGGVDNIFGYAGDDILIGGQGADTLTGGDGADTFRFEGGSGANVLAKAASLGTDLIQDYDASENDLFELSNGDFALGAAGTLTDGTNYFETDTTTIGAAGQDLSSGVANAGIVIIGSANGADGAEVWYTDDASNMSTSNSYQIADVDGADRSTLDAGDFHLKS